MKQLLMLALAALMVCACGNKFNGPVADAISAEVMKGVNEPYKFRFQSLTLLDSTTFATEFARRINVYEIQLDQNAARVEKYTKQGMHQNAAKVFQEYKRGQKILGELEAMREQMGDDTLKIAYYDYSFSGVARLSKGRKKVFELGYAAVTPDNRVLSVAGDPKSIHKATGLAIPGYQELLDSFKAEGIDIEE